MIRTTIVPIKIGELKPTSLDIEFTLAIDLDGVVPMRAVAFTDHGPGPTHVRTEVDAAVWWDLLAADEQDEIVREICEDAKNPADKWDFNDSMGLLRQAGEE